LSRLKHYFIPLLSIILTGSLLFFHSLLLEPLTMLLSETSGTALELWVTASFYMSITWLLARYIQVEIIAGLIEARSGRPAPKLLGNLVGLLVFLSGITFIMTNVFGKDITALLATSGVGVIIIGVALKDLISSVFSGLVLNFQQYFKIGDVIECQLLGKHIVGRIVEINWRSTHVQTSDQKTLIIPNSIMADSALFNYDLPDKKTRTMIEVYMDYDIASESAERILQAAVLATEGILKKPKPSISIAAMQKDCLVYHLFFWSPDWDSSSDNRHRVIKNILKQMQHTNIQVAYPKSEILLTRERPEVSKRSLDKTFLLNQIALFRLFPLEVREKIVTKMIEQHYTKGEEIVKIGQKKDALFIVAEGLVNRVVDDFAGNPPTIQKFAATEFFGALSLFTGKPHIAAVTAETNVVIYAITRAHMQPIMHQHRQLVGPISEMLAQHQMQLAGKMVQHTLPYQQELEELKTRYIGQILSTYF